MMHMQHFLGLAGFFLFVSTLEAANLRNITVSCGGSGEVPCVRTTLKPCPLAKAEQRAKQQQAKEEQRAKEEQQVEQNESQGRHMNPFFLALLFICCCCSWMVFCSLFMENSREEFESNQRVYNGPNVMYRNSDVRHDGPRSDVVYVVRSPPGSVRAPLSAPGSSLSTTGSVRAPLSAPMPTRVRATGSYSAPRSSWNEIIAVTNSDVNVPSGYNLPRSTGNLRETTENVIIVPSRGNVPWSTENVITTETYSDVNGPIRYNSSRSAGNLREPTENVTIVETYNDVNVPSRGNVPWSTENVITTETYTDVRYNEPMSITEAMYGSSTEVEQDRVRMGSSGYSRRRGEM